MIDDAVMERLIHVPDEDEQMEELVNELSTEGFAVTNFSKGGIFYTLLRVAVHIGIELKKLAVNLINSAFMTHCPDDWVEIRAADYSKTRKAGVKAEGYITVIREDFENACTVKKGHPFRSKADAYGNCLRYYAVEDTILEAGQQQGKVYVQAENAGTGYNLPAGSITQTLVYIEGYKAVENEEGWLVIEGTEEESIEALRRRCLNSRAENAIRTTDGKIKSVVDAIPGVVVSEIDSQHPRGQGTVDIIITGPSGTAGDSILQAVREAVAPLAGSYGDYLVKSAIAQAVDVSLVIYTDAGISTEGYTDRARQAVLDLMAIDGRDPLNVLYRDDIITAVKNALQKCRKCVILTPENDVAMPKGTVLVAGSVDVETGTV